MPDFKKMAEQAKATSDAQVSQTQKELQAEAAASAAEFQRRTTELDAKVTPNFSEAASAIEATGVPVVVKNNWADGTRPMRPEVVFQCEGPKITNAHGGHQVPKGIAVRAQYWDSGIVIAIDQDASNQAVERIGGPLEDAIPEAIRRALESYYRSLEQIKTRS